MTVTFKWQIVTDIYDTSCGLDISHWLNLRLDTEIDNSEYRSTPAYIDFCTSFSDIGNGAQATGWQDASVVAPASSAEFQNITFSIGGWYYGGWYGLIDEVEVSQ